ncbi:response regulator [Thermoleptolyngbya sp. C42_A2020_037]|uniref:response regulator n=1 Tax=Thermoleptolyngbya sp. C42_A2020_037 TaxID=2747799 RepID=UPI0019E97C6A|nr:response regulator [Thermoleptolyngbya sp. C42_A2020_037]MBF2083114.1 response regulator [Thermoleptolyngbya sp. C42_A2020_037]
MRLLLVEDDELFVHALSTYLVAQRYAVDVATDGESGWSYIQATTYDLVVLDVNLPKLNGFQLCQRIRQAGYHQPILLLTAKDDSADKVTGLDAGADDYVVKPCTVEELSARIRALLRRQHLPAAPVLERSGLRLDPDACKVTYRGQEVSLTSKEYSLLELFLRYPQRVFSSSSILERLWAFEESPGEEAVRALMKRLRQKLRAAGTSDLIETLYGQGYRLKPLEEDSAGDRPALASASDLDPAPTPVPDPNSNCRDPREAALEAWEHFREPMLEQLAYLDQAVAMLQRESFSPAMRDLAEQAAHKLAGALGMFGFPQGSRLARAIEQHLQATDAPIAVAPLSLLVAQLQEELSSPPQLSGFLAGLSPSVLSELSDRQSPLALLIMHETKAFVAQVQTEGASCDIEAEKVTSVAAARAAIARRVPDAVLLSLTLVNALPGGLELLQDLTAQFPTLPILVIANSDNLGDRLALLCHSRCQFVPEDVPLGTLLMTVRDVVESHQLAGMRVLVVDDDPMVLTALRQMLLPWQVHLFTLEDSSQFWETLSAIAPDLLILDVEMPQMNGVQICQIVRSDHTWNRLPIIFLTEHQDMATVQQLLSVGADDYLTKPFSESELLSRLCNRLSRTRLSPNQLRLRLSHKSA